MISGFTFAVVAVVAVALYNAVLAVKTANTKS